MVTAQTQYSLANARSYFTEHLAVGDYYAEGQTIAGEWFGEFLIQRDVPPGAAIVVDGAGQIGGAADVGSPPFGQ